MKKNSLKVLLVEENPEEAARTADELRITGIACEVMGEGETWGLITTGFSRQFWHSQTAPVRMVVNATFKQRSTPL